MANQSEFIQSYSKIVAKTWVDDEFFNDLLADPKAILDENGLETPEDAEVRIVTVASDNTGEGSLDGQHARWEQGEETGTYELYISLKPEDFDPENVSLSDAELEAVAGGGAQAEADSVDISCCCCTPCCCCT